jgi:predicted nucleic acid-binding protein
MILLDSSILIELFRATNKEKTHFYRLAASESDFAISIITHYEIYIGSNEKQDSFWTDFMDSVVILDFDLQTSKQAVKIYKHLKKTNKLIDLADIFIAATSISYNIPLATLNISHFQRIKELEIKSVLKDL